MSNSIVNFNQTRISQVRNLTQNDFGDMIFKTDFEIVNIPVALANALRRTFSTLCPTITFNDTYYDNTEFNSIKIINNTSSLHNEFVTHRLSLIPLFMNNSYFQKSIVTQCNEDGERVWKFRDSSIIPQFKINMKNTIDEKDSRDTSGIIDVNTHNFEVSIINSEEEGGDLKFIDPKEFFLPDFYTSEPILINKLKSNMASKQEGEEMIVNCTPKIGLGKQNSRNDPTGTVKYSFKIDEANADIVFQKKLEYLQKERVQKGLGEYSETEISKLKRSFDLLDKERVYLKNSNGEPNYFNFSVESIGFMSSSQIIYDSVVNLKLTLGDIKNGFIIQSENKNLKLSVKKKIEITSLDRNNVNNGCLIKIIDENHTVGNLLQYYLRKNFLSNNNVDEKPLKIAGYRMNHPTIEEIEFIIIPKDKFSKENLITMIKEILETNPDFRDIDYGMLNTEYEYKIIHYLCVLLFIKSINNAIKDIDLFINEFSQKSGISDTLYDISDPDDYLQNNSF